MSESFFTMGRSSLSRIKSSSPKLARHLSPREIFQFVRKFARGNIPRGDNCRGVGGIVYPRLEKVHRARNSHPKCDARDFFEIFSMNGAIKSTRLVWSGVTRLSFTWAEIINVAGAWPAHNWKKREIKGIEEVRDREP